MSRHLRDYLLELREEHGVKSLALFGSYVRGEEEELSDLDILVEFSRVPDLFEFVALKHRISDLLGIKVDLVMKSALRPSIEERIAEDIVMV